MSNIVWKDEAVFYANNTQFRKNYQGFQRYNDTLESWQRTIDGGELEETLSCGDFQLNEIRQGDYIEASELDTEQKYNDAVAVFGLFGFNHLYSFGEISELITNLTVDDDYKLHPKSTNNKDCVRKLTYPQLMAIGKLKRAMIERDKSNSSELPNSSNWSDEHYNHFYQLTSDDIERGEVKVDAYFVNRMWKINSWEDTGAGFHILKTLPRIANNKNSLKRELVALKKQVDILCKLHGVDDDTN